MSIIDKIRNERLDALRLTRDMARHTMECILIAEGATNGSTVSPQRMPEYMDALCTLSFCDRILNGG